ncbi:MAG: class I SAM-dependent methyltransferase [Ignavibacteriae bacterium]|nr:class I SAM-dependent methyltransferase [Ignavibacteriota bacterium]
MENIFEDVDCPVCGTSINKIKFGIKYYSNNTLKILNYSGNAPDVSLYICRYCGHHYASPQIKSSYLNIYYYEFNSEYYNLNSEPKDNLPEEHRKIYNLIRKKIDKGRVLELGSGFGFLLNEFPDDKWEKYGVEPSKFASTFAGNKFNIKIKNGFLNYGDYLPNSFDLIIFFDLIEHLKNPNEFADLIKSYLKADGLIVFGTGNINSINSKLSGNLWSYYSSWEHISFFSPKSAGVFLNNNGLELIEIIKLPYNGTFLTNVKNFIKNLTVVRMKNMVKFFLNIFNNKKFTYSYYNLSFDHMLVFGKIKDVQKK